MPFAFGLEREQFFLTTDAHFFGALSWLVFVTSIGTMVLWFYLLKKDAVRANNWLFLTPVFGYSLAALLLNETVSIYDMMATIFVVSGLLLSGNIPMPRKKTRRMNS